MSGPTIGKVSRISITEPSIFSSSERFPFKIPLSSEVSDTD